MRARLMHPWECQRPVRLGRIRILQEEHGHVGRFAFSYGAKRAIPLSHFLGVGHVALATPDVSP